MHNSDSKYYFLKVCLLVCNLDITGVFGKRVKYRKFMVSHGWGKVWTRYTFWLKSSCEMWDVAQR